MVARANYCFYGTCQENQGLMLSTLQREIAHLEGGETNPSKLYVVWYFRVRTIFREPSSLRSSNSAHEKVQTRKIDEKSVHKIVINHHF